MGRCKGPRVLFQLLWLYNKLSPKLHGAKQLFIMLSDSVDQEFRQDTASQHVLPDVWGFNWKTYRQGSGIIYQSHTQSAPVCGFVQASLKHSVQGQGQHGVQGQRCLSQRRSERARESEWWAEAILPFETQPLKPSSITSTAPCCSSHKLPLRFKRNSGPHHSVEGVSKPQWEKKKHVEWKILLQSFRKRQCAISSQSTFWKKRTKVKGFQDLQSYHI